MGLSALIHVPPQRKMFQPYGPVFQPRNWPRMSPSLALSDALSKCTERYCYFLSLLLIAVFSSSEAPKSVSLLSLSCSSSCRILGHHGTTLLQNNIGLSAHATTYLQPKIAKHIKYRSLQKSNFLFILVLVSTQRENLSVLDLCLWVFSSFGPRIAL